jgi:hypothetical protein
MKFTIENLGALDYAEMDLADLTIICGQNNTGKTYVTYLVFCLLSTWRQFIDIDLGQDLLKLKKDGVVRIDLNERVAKEWPKLCDDALERFLSAFPEMMASRSELFANLKMQVDIPLGTGWRARDFKRELRSAQGNLLLTMNKAANSIEIELVALKSEDLRGQAVAAFGQFIEDRLFDLLLDESIPSAFIASTERTGATTFRKQLNLAMSKFQELLIQAHKDGAESMAPDRVFETMYARHDYALPVRRNVAFVNQLPDPNAEPGSLFKNHPELLNKFEAIVGGSYSTNKEGVTVFQPHGSKLKLGLGEVSSSVRSLLIVWYWLKYVASQGEMLVLDEPELNLHPANQRRLARFIAALINHGVKVFLTTHSDYIVKELNTLIMLHQPSEKLTAILAKLPDYDADDKLNPNSVLLYMAQEENRMRPGGKRKTRMMTLTRAEVSPTLGIDSPSFDATIDDMNAVQEAIYYGLR